MSDVMVSGGRAKTPGGAWIDRAARWSVESPRAIWAVLALAVVMRLPVAFLPALHHPDELWQYLEPANHLAGGRWLATWEYRVGARSWLVPSILAGPLWAWRHWAPALPAVVLPRLLCLLLSLGIVWAAAELGQPISRRHRLVVAFVAATWFELVYFGARTLSEPIALSVLFVGIGLLRRSRAAVAVAGGLFALACLIRFQYSAPVAVLAIVALRLDVRRWAFFLGGALVAIVLGSIPDLLIDGAPLRWLSRNYTANVIQNRSAVYGIEGPFWYLLDLARLWLVFAVPIVAFAVIAARRYPELLAAALVNIALHMLIPHKEYRFILLSTTLIVVLAALGSVDVAQRFLSPRRAIPVLVTGWFAASVACGALGSIAPGWGNHAPLGQAWGWMGRRADLCGAAIYRPHDRLVASYVLLGRDVPIYSFDAATAREGRASLAFDSALSSRANGFELPGYRLAGCAKHDICLFERPGGCRASPADARYEANRDMIAHGD